MYRIVGTVKGIVPLLFNKPPANFRSDGKKSEAQYRKMAEEAIYINDHGVFIPGWNFKQCIVNGASMAGLKVGQKGLGQFLEASLFPDNELQFVGKKKSDFMHEHWGRRPPRTGAACWIYRPALREAWVLRFGILISDDRREEAVIRRCIDEAGMLVGLGSWRPEYGRFMVDDWKVEKGKT